MKRLLLAFAIACSLHCSGSANVNGENPAGRDCDELRAAYDDALGRAKQCNGTSGNPCLVQVPSRLSPCPTCGTFVNAADQELLEELDDLHDGYEDSGCDDGDAQCPAIDCVPPDMASCLDGVCSDNN